MSAKDVPDAAVVRACVAGRKSGKTTLEELAVATGQPRKVCLRAIERAIERGFADCGVSVRTAWATRKGLDLLR